MNKDNKKYYYNDSLREFEGLNHTTESIYELGDYPILIILDDGRNITCPDEIENDDSVIFISENLENQDNLTRRYNYPNLKAIIALNLSAKVQNTSYMFYSCNALTTISGLDTWNTQSIRDMHGMFKNCIKLSDIHSINSWDLSNLHDTSYMFENCSSLSSLSDLNDWNTSKIRDMTAMFRDCTSLESLDGLSNWNFDSICDIERLFENCISLKNIDSVRKWRMAGDVNMEKVFKDCISLDGDVESILDKWRVNTTLQKNSVKKSTTLNAIKQKKENNANVDTTEYIPTQIFDEKEEKILDFSYRQDFENVMKVLKKEYQKNNSDLY